MTETLERRLLRRSLDNHLDSPLDDRRRRSSPRHSLTGNHNKENFGVHFVRHSFGNTSLSALQDLSNGKSPRRPKDITPLSRLKFRNKIKEDSLSSSRMGDVTLDRMLDAIIESARKDVKTACPPKTPEPETKDVDKDDSIHEMEVRTPQHLKRQRVVRRKNPKTTDKKVNKEKAKEKRESDMKKEREEEATSFKTTRSQTHREMIGLTLPNGIPSPETPEAIQHYANHKSLLDMETPPPPPSASQQHMLFDVGNSVAVHCSTPTLALEGHHSIKRCLSFSCASEEDTDDGSYTNSKRGSITSSIASSTNEQLSGSCSSNSLTNVAAGGRGSLDVAIYLDNETLNVHVIRCRDLQRSNGTSSNNLNAYVKVALIRQSQNQPQSYQRTVVHRHSNRPYFDHCFKFDLSDLAAAVEEVDPEDRLQMAVWHRDRQHKRSEFLGCVSFPLATLLQQREINGSYKLQAQTCLNQAQQHQQQQQQPRIGELVHQTAINHCTRHTTAPATTATTTAITGVEQGKTLSSHGGATGVVVAQASSSSLRTATQYPNNIPQVAMAAMTQMRNTTDDAVSIDSMAAPVATSGALLDHYQQTPMILSKKALHQRDADENLFLRFLELDPPNSSDAMMPTTPGGGRRLSNSKPIGRTPFTMTKKLTRTAERGFGFSIVWTHPPRVEKVEPGLSADRCGILPGDYVIFVDKHNVVTMPEADVLNLIRSQGATLTLEIFRRSGSGTGATGAATGSSHTTTTATGITTATTHRSLATTIPMNGKTSRMTASSGTSINQVIMDDTKHQRPPTACSVGTTMSSVEAAKRRLNLPQVTFSKESIAPITDNRRRFLLQLISREQNFMSALHFGMQRFVQPLAERKDLITPNDHRTLFQNMDELLRISEDILEQLCHDDQEPQMNFASRVYLSKTTAICAAYKKYCNGIKRADCVLVNKSRQAGSEFVAFITEPPVPRKRPDLTMFIHRPLQHFREILKLMQLLASNCHVDTEEHKNFNTVINELQAAYREITVSSGLMEPLGEGRPLLTLQDLESRMVFTKCKPFTLAVQGRQWIFGGDLSRVEGRSVKPYWTLLFSDIIVFAKVSRDRVLFITEEPIPIANIVDSCFHMRKKTTEFRLTVDPNGRLAESPTGYCAPDLTKTPKKGARRKSLVLRAPSLELKAVWQNLLQRQIFLVNAALGSTPLSSPLDSPDVLNTLVPLSDIGLASASIGSIKLSSMDSINLKNQQHNQQNNRLTPQVSEQIEKLIDEKCRILNKTGTSKSSALHLANWMKGQLDKQQEQARLVVSRFIPENQLEVEANTDTDTDANQNEQGDERITYWTRQQLEKRTQELNLAKENGHLTARPNFGGKRLSGVDELSMSDVSHCEALSQISQSHSTTSDSQITVRSSPIVLDKLAVCRHCHKNCQKNPKNALAPSNASETQAHEKLEEDKEATEVEKDLKAKDPLSSCPLSPNSMQKSGLVCNSLKVQHSQSSPHRCCKINGNGSASRASSITSISSGTVTGAKPPRDKQQHHHNHHHDHSSRSSNRDDVDDTESDVAQLLTDDNYCPSETTVDEGDTGFATASAKIGQHKTANTDEATSSSTTSSATSSTTSTTSISSTQLEANATTSATTTTNQETDTNAAAASGKSNGQQLTGRVHHLRILEEESNEVSTPLTNGHCERREPGEDEYEELVNLDSHSKPEPPPRKFIDISAQQAKVDESQEGFKEGHIKTSITLSETAKVVQITQSPSKSPEKSPRSPKTPTKSPKTPSTPKSDRSASSSTKSKQFVACHCNCLPEDFANTTLSPEEVELKTCKLLESPKQSPKMPKSPDTQHQQQETSQNPQEDPHRFCHCTCNQKQHQQDEQKKQSPTPGPPPLKAKNQPRTDEDEDDDLSLMLIGLAQLTPTAKLLNMTTPTAPLPTPTQNFNSYGENGGGFVPTIAIVPATPDSVLTKTSTNVWDNTSHLSSNNSHTATSSTTNLLISNIPRHQAVIENIPEDSCDESPLDEEPPYRPMSNTLRRYGTMSSLEKLPSEDRVDNDDYEDDDDDDDDDDVEVDDDDDEELMDKARADNIELDNEIRVVTKAIYSTEEASGSLLDSTTSNSSAWTSRASTFVSGKMSFFEESRAFIDKYLGRWNQEQTDSAGPALTSDPEEQMDECTSGATSGEEVWGTPTSGGDNDDMHMANSENTHSSPTKSSNSLNDDDDTELMMDELLMAPPMSASTIRGLLPRRRLEPLFEEETESDEEKTQQESEELKKGETTTNGHYLEDSEAGSSSEEEDEEEEEMEDHVNTADYEEDEDLTSTEERLQPQLQTTILGPRPLSKPLQVGANVLPQAVLKASSCEYLLDQHTIKATNSNEAIPTAVTMPQTISVTADSDIAKVEAETSLTKMTTSMSTTITTAMITAMTTTMTPVTAITTTPMETCITTVPTIPTTPNPVVSLASTTISNVNATTESERGDKMPAEALAVSVPKNEVKTLPRPAKFIPPPPPPRRLLLTQTNLKTSGTDTKPTAKAPQPQRKSGVFADTGSSVGVKDDGHCGVKNATPTANIPAHQHTATMTTTPESTTTMTRRTTTATPKDTNVEDVCAIRNYSANNISRNTCDSMKRQIEQQQQTGEPQLQRLSSTIIETSLLSLMDNSGSSNKTKRQHCTSSTTVSKTRGKCPMKPERKQVATTQTTETTIRTTIDMEQELQMEMQRPQAEHVSDSTSICAQPAVVGSALSPRLEMRLALNQDIMGDEDLISYDPGPDLTTILVHDLSTFHRLTGRDLLNRSAMNRVQPKEAVISYSQQRNSKMDTPTVNRRPRPHLNNSINNGNAATGMPVPSTMASTTTTIPAASSMPFAGSVRVADVQQHLQPNRNTWSNFAFADRNRDVNASDANSKDDSKLSDLEILARREKIYCMSQLRSGSRVKTMTTTKIMASTTATTITATDSNSLNNPLTTRTTNTTSMVGASEELSSTSKKGHSRQRKISRDETALMETGKANKLINFIKRRNSEIPPSANNSQTSLNDSNSSSTPQHKQAPMSPRKDNDKPSLNRRLWKQITKRRRSNSVSELVAS
ncbi:protostome-specific GEF [Musca autumnalis]|uniref:protostome-specific GEF n=1 Tax=Musca autumnalis TaxID=221902 RepID=UPI003CE78324